MPDWLRSPEFWIASTALSVALFIASLVAIPILCVRMPPDYFVRPPPTRPPWMIALRAIAAIVLVTMGVAMLVLPGQGLLTIVIGLSILDFPGKRALLNRLLRKRLVLRAMNAIRRKASKPPLLPP